MAQPTPIFFKITETGKNAALDAKNAGLTLRLDRLGVGRAKYTPIGDETALRDEFMRSGITSGDIDEKGHTLRFSSSLNASNETEVWELGLFDDHNRLFAIASRTNKPLLKIYPDITLVASFGLTLDELDLGSITMVVDPSSAILAANNFDELRRAIEELRKRPFEGIPVGGILTTAKHYENGDEVADDLRYGKWQRFAQGKVLAGFSSIAAHGGAFKNMGNEFGAINKSGGNDYRVVAFWQRMSDDWEGEKFNVRYKVTTDRISTNSNLVDYKKLDNIDTKNAKAAYNLIKDNLGDEGFITIEVWTSDNQQRLEVWQTELTKSTTNPPIDDPSSKTPPLKGRFSGRISTPVDPIKGLASIGYMLSFEYSDRLDYPVLDYYVDVRYRYFTSQPDIDDPSTSDPDQLLVTQSNKINTANNKGEVFIPYDSTLDENGGFLYAELYHPTDNRVLDRRLAVISRKALGGSSGNTSSFAFCKAEMWTYSPNLVKDRGIPIPEVINPKTVNDVLEYVDYSGLYLGGGNTQGKSSGIAVVSAQTLTTQDNTPTSMRLSGYLVREPYFVQNVTIEKAVLIMNGVTIVGKINGFNNWDSNNPEKKPVRQLGIALQFDGLEAKMLESTAATIEVYVNDEQGSNRRFSVGLSYSALDHTWQTIDKANVG